MFQTAKRCLVVLLALLMVLTCVWSAFTVQAATDVLFEDSFSGGALAGWASTNVGSVANGEYKIDGTGANAIASVGSAENYAIFADVKIDRTKTGSESGYHASGMATLAFLASADLSSGYEFGLGINKTGSTYAVVYKSGAQPQILYQRAINIPGVEGGKIQAGTGYALKVITLGKQVTCYINNKEFYSFTAQAATGYAGVSAWCAKGSFDNVALRRAGEKKLEKIELKNTPDEITVAGYFEFDILATYGGVYGQETISSEEEGVNITGLDGKTGKKTLTVTYGGKSAKFTTNVVKAVAQVLATEDFSTDTGVWASSVNDKGVTPTKMEVTGGKLVGKMPAVTADAPYTLSATYNNAKNVLKDLYYSIEVSAVIKANSSTETERDGLAILRFVSSGGNYQFRVSSSGTAQLYNGNTELLDSANCKDAVALNKTFTMRVEVLGGTIVCYVNNQPVISGSFETKDATPVVQLQVYNGWAEFDNMVIKQLEGKSKWSIRSMQTVDQGGTPVSSFAGRSFSPTKYALRVTYFDDTTFLVPVTASMVDGYDPSVKSTQTVRFVYGPKSVKFSVTYKDYLYHNDFSGGMNMIDRAHPNATSEIRAGVMYVNYTKPENNATVNKASIISEGVAEYTNYSVSADVAILDGNTPKVQYVGFGLRSGGGGTTYAYRLIYNSSGAVYLYLYHNTGTGNQLIRQWAPAQLLATYEDTVGVSIGLNQFYNIKIELIGNMLYCYFNNVLLDIIVDDSVDYVEGPGTVALEAINTSAAFDNIYIYPLEARDPKNITLSGDIVKDGVLQAYQGYEVEPEAVSLHVNYTDGYVSTQPLWSDYIVEGYDSNVLGEQMMTISYRGVTAQVPVNVYQRPEYIADFVAKVKSFKKGSLTAADAAGINELIRYFTTLSPYEVKHLDQDVYKTYVDLVTEMDKLASDTLKDSEQLLYYDFTQEETFADWVIDSKSGDMVVRNGSFVNEQKKKNVAGGTLMYNQNSYGTVLSAEVDIMLLYPATYTALVIYGSKSVYYHARITNKPVDEDGNPVMTVQLYKYSSGSQLKLGATYPILKDVVIEEGKWNNLRMDLNDGLISVYVDDVLMLQYDDSQSTDYITDGYVGIRNNENDAKYDNLRAYGVKKDAPTMEYVKEIEPTEYVDDFEDETVGKDPSHWVEYNTKNEWKVYNKGGSKVYGVSKKEKTFSWLHAFEVDPVYSAKLMSTSGTGRVGLITRLVNEAAHLAIGYDFAQKKWYFASNGSEDVEEQVYYAENTASFSLAEWHDVEVTLDDARLTVKCDGETVLTHDAVKYASFGRMGVYAENADLYIDDVKITSKNGAIFNNGVVEATLDTERYIGSLEIEDLSENLLVGTFGGNVFVSEDAGQTFVTDEEYGAFDNLPDSGYPSYLDLGNGKWLAISNATIVYISNDNMKNWENIALILPEEERYDPLSGQSLPIIHTSSLTKVTMPNGVTRIFLPIAMRNPDSAGNILGHYARFFYSDDGGYTWTESENDSRDLIPNYNNATNTTYAEGKIIACADGSVRYYQTRNKTGSTIYLESKDYGQTWTEFGKISHMQAPVGSFGIEEDPTSPGTYYMAWVSSFPSALGSILPRTRLSLARTTDGKNWEFLTDVFRTSDFDSDDYTDLRQLVDPSVCVTKDYIYVTYSVASKYANSAHNALRIRYCRLEKANLTVHEWNDATISDTTAPEKIEFATLPQTKFGYADLFQTTGMEIKVTALNGNVTTEGGKEYFLVNGEPNMFKLGKQTVRLMSKYYMFLEYEIEIVPNYDLIWSIRGKGTVDPNPDATTRMMEGATQTFTLKPAKGYKVSYVNVNGQNLKLEKGTFTLSNVQETQEITVVFVKKTIMDYLLWIIVGAVALAGIAVLVVLLIVKRKPKPAQMEDISSNSTPPTDEN